jgi:arabinose-5-phosphate isomerase
MMKPPGGAKTICRDGAKLSRHVPSARLASPFHYNGTVSGAVTDPKTDVDLHPSIAEARRVLEVEAAAILGLKDRLDQNFISAVEVMYQCQGRVITMGMGKSGIICKKISSTLASTGTPSFFLHPAEAIHGDLGMVVKGDVVLAVSNSGETEELVRLLESVKRIGAVLVSMTGNPSSSLARNSDYHLSAAISREACPLGLAPTASTTATLALGDALAMAILIRKGFREEDFALLHPGGKLGKRFLRVRDLMHKDDQVPVVTLTTPMKDVIYEMSRKGFGITAVVDGGGVLRGVVSDGDLRRLLQRDEEVVRRTAEECMKRDPVTIAPNQLASAALQILEQKKITSLFITDPAGKVQGILHLHDLWGLELF